MRKSVGAPYQLFSSPGRFVLVEGRTLRELELHPNALNSVSPSRLGRRPRLSQTGALAPSSVGPGGTRTSESDTRPCGWRRAAAQAINRAHRIGQTRPVTIHRLVTDASVDENVYNIALRKKR